VIKKVESRESRRKSSTPKTRNEENLKEENSREEMKIGLLKNIFLQLKSVWIYIHTEKKVIYISQNKTFIDNRNMKKECLRIIGN